MDILVVCMFFVAWKRRNTLTNEECIDSAVKHLHANIYSSTDLLASIEKAKADLMRQMQEGQCEGDIIKLVSWTAVAYNGDEYKTLNGN